MSSLKGRKVAFVGLGNMGIGMARNLLKAGVELVAVDLSPSAVAAIVKDGATAAKTPAEAAAQAEVVIVMVHNTPAATAVIVGENGVIHGIKPGTVVIDMGTTTVEADREFAKKIIAAGGKFLDSPVSGGAEGARTATLAIMTGGDEAVFEQVKPILQAMGAKVTHVGDVGAGQVAKDFNQIIVGVTIQAVAEAVTLARKAGVDPAKIRDAVRGGYAESLILDRHALRMIERDFSAPGLVSITHKDLTQALAFARSMGLHLPALEMNEALFQKCIDDGHGSLDHSALIKAIDPEA